MEKPVILLHICCAPCSTVPITRLLENFKVVGFFYNPNIYPEKEYYLRVKEMDDYASRLGMKLHIGEYDKLVWHELTKHLNGEPEGGKRCEICYRMRLLRTAEEAVKRRIKSFTTALTLSPLKRASTINTIGEEAARLTGITFLPENFKKKDGFKQSCEISKTEKLYRQDYCGCIYSIPKK